MRNSIFILIAGWMMIVSSCGGNKAEEQKKQQEALAKEVIAVHDEIMPKMGELMSLKKKVKAKAEAWTATPGEGTEAKTAEAEEIVAALEAADKAMMDWMHEYNGGQGLYEHEAIMEYLNGEMEKIKKVKEDMLSSMERANAFLEANP
jgi:hypothetical protein